jgi:hypothetical protein
MRRADLHDVTMDETTVRGAAVDAPRLAREIVEMP